MIVDAANHAVVPHRPIPTAANVVFACPDNLNGYLRCLCNLYRFDNEIGGWVCTTTETTAKQGRVNFDLLRLQSCGRGGGHAIDGLKLRAGPYLAMIHAQVDYAIQWLHHRMGQVRHFVLSRD